MRVSDSIELFIKNMLLHNEQEVELKRNELAVQFGCAPSQINYVLSTRFTPDHGYLIESRRGGGGYIRIVRIEQTTEEEVFERLSQRIGMAVDEMTASRLISQMQEMGIVTEREAALMNSATSSQALALPFTPEVKGALRAMILRRMMMEALRNQQSGQKEGGITDAVR